MNIETLTSLEDAPMNYTNATDNLATEMLREIKSENKRKSKIIYTLIAALIATVAGFLIYLSLPVETTTTATTTTTTTTNTADGFYAIVDSEGNTIVSDLTPEEIESIARGMTTDG